MVLFQKPDTCSQTQFFRRENYTLTEDGALKHEVNL